VVVGLHLEDDRPAGRPASITPAFSPGPTRTRGPVVGKVFRYLRDDL